MRLAQKVRPGRRARRELLELPEPLVLVAWCWPGHSVPLGHSARRVLPELLGKQVREAWHP